MSQSALVMTEEQALDLIRGTLRGSAPPLAIYLFGSRSSGTARPDSDFDILAVVDEPQGLKERVALSSHWRGLLARQGLDVDILVKTPRELEDYRDKAGSLIHSALRTGKAL
ncbi:MAG: nucleotidyltransferase domain-containing protein [Spirochaetaceae bacterium]|nr:nucleotidyltransferase domain-containing protein [Spirochaetaceae bacterium]